MHEGIDRAVGRGQQILAERVITGDHVVVVELVGPEDPSLALISRAISIMRLKSASLLRFRSLGTMVSFTPSARMVSPFFSLKASE